MQKSFAHFILLIKRLSIVLLIFMVCRLLFYFFNYRYFTDTRLGELASYLFFGLRFDISAIIVINSLYIVFQLIPLQFRYHPAYQRSLNILFFVTNSVAILANCIDLVYFRFTVKRTTADALAFFTMGDDLANLMPVFLKDYWYVFAVWLALTAIMIWIYRKAGQAALKEGAQWHLKQSLLFVPLMGVFLLGYRGGFQLKPVSIISAGEYADAKHIPLVVNTPFTIIKTLEQPGIEPLVFMADEQALSLYSPFHKGEKGPMKRMNVVILIMESFSKEYIGALSGKRTYTPFLDSLINEGYIFTRAYANGKRSIEALPSITASVPTIMNEPYITSLYGSNPINALPSLLGKEGYSTSFYHGGVNGTMGFDAFARLAGFDEYYGLNEYPHPEDYDGNWGIWDEKFFQFFAKELDQTQQPFFSTFFSLTSHHPFRIPAQYKDRFPEGPLEIHKGISYADYSLKKFFQTASQMPWFKNTLFVITADHTGLPGSAYSSNSIGNYEVPILLYAPGDSAMKGRDSSITQQVDIMPTILTYLNYDKEYFAFGNNAYRSLEPGWAVQFFNDTYQLLKYDYALLFDGTKATGLYNFTADSLLQNNLLNQQPSLAAKMEQQLKAFIQVYHQSLINNRMTSK